MPQRIIPNKVVTMTKDGECHVIITLDLNININTSGQLQVDNLQAEAFPVAAEVNESANWVVPDFGPSNSNILEFGKDV
jgi:hypothetical protein